MRLICGACLRRSGSDDDPGDRHPGPEARWLRPLVGSGSGVPPVRTQTPTSDEAQVPWAGATRDNTEETDSSH